MSLTLYHITHSPWSMKARTALAHHQLEPTLIEYAPFVGEPALRLKIARHGGSFWGRLTVPILFTPDTIVRDSWDIARYADRHGDSSSLLPFEERDAISEWNRRSDVFLNAGRARFALRVLGEDNAIRELAPGSLAKMPMAVQRLGIRQFANKYGARAEQEPLYRQQMRDQLLAMRTTLASGQPYLCDGFSYADIAMVVALKTLKPEPGSSFGPHCEAISGDQELADEFTDVITYRDRIRREHGVF